MPEALRQTDKRNSLARSAKSTPSSSTTFAVEDTLPGNATEKMIQRQKWCWTPTLCRRHGFRFYFTALIGLLFTFPSRYWFTIGDIRYLVLAKQSGRIPAGHSFPAVLKSRNEEYQNPFRIRGCYPLWRAVPGVFCYGSFDFYYSPSCDASLSCNPHIQHCC